MDKKDITVEEQKQLDRELTEKALKGADIVRVMMVLQIIGIVYRFITVDELLVFRFLETAINAVFLLEFRKGASGQGHFCLCPQFLALSDQ